MGRLFAGTPWDRPPTCDHCGLVESECACPPQVVEVVHVAPETQTARLRVEKRPKGKVVTVVTVVKGLEEGNDLEALAATLKGKCGTGGTVKDGAIELQGDHLAKVDAALAAIGYKTKRG